MNMICKPFLFLLFCVCATVLFAQNSTEITTADELKSFYDVSLLPRFLPNTISSQISTYDTTGGNNDGFGGEYSFIRRNKDSSLVVFDIKGPGVINRIWTPTPTDDTFDFYVDDMKRPALSICYSDLFSGKVFPFVQPLCGNQLGGYYCYYPILFQKACRIICRGKKLQFHQIGYRLYPAGTKVESFTNNITSGESITLTNIKTLWSHSNKSTSDFVPANESLLKIDSSITLQPGDTKSIAAIATGGRITGIELFPAASFEGLYKNIDIRISYDDETLPAVNCPVADFFGFAFGKPSMQSLLIGTANGKLYCYLPMPFTKKVNVQLIYRKAADTLLLPVRLVSSVAYTTKPLQANEGKLYTHWQQSKPEAGRPFVFLDVKGRGHYVGTILQAQGLQTGMTVFFEGDDSTIIDGKMQLHGTGSEDHFNGGWYALKDRWDADFSLPVHGALDYSLLFARTGAYRLYLNDKLSFDKSFYHTIEHGGDHNEVPVLYTSVAFYYSNTPAQKIMEPKDADTKIYVPDTLNIFPEFTKLSPGYNMTMETSWDSASTGQSYKMTVNDESMLTLFPKDIPPGTYKVFADVVNQPEGCLFSLWQRQSQLSGWIDTKAGKNTWVIDKPVGEITITGLNNTMTLHFQTDDAHHRFWLSKLMLVKMK